MVVVIVRSSFISRPNISRDPLSLTENWVRTAFVIRKTTDPLASLIGPAPRRRPPAASNSLTVCGPSSAVTTSPSRVNATAFPIHSSACGPGGLKSVTSLRLNPNGPAPIPLLAVAWSSVCQLPSKSTAILPPSEMNSWPEAVGSATRVGPPRSVHPVRVPARRSSGPCASATAVVVVQPKLG